MPILGKFVLRARQELSEGPMELLSNNAIFRTKSMDEGLEFMGQLWERNQKEILDGDYNVAWSHRDFGKSSLSFIAHDCTVDFKAEGQKADCLRIFVPQKGFISHTVRGRSFVSSPDNLAVHAPGVDVTFRFHRFEMLLLNLSGDAFRQSLAQRFGEQASMEEMIGSLPNSPGVETLRSAVQWIASEASREGTLLNGESKASLYADRMLQALVMDCLSQLYDTPAPSRASDIQARQAEAWIDAHLAEPIGVEEVATAVGVSVRSLEQTFKRTRGYSPYQAILRMRFERAREALLNADETATVTQIAIDHGFFELGRFSVRYRQRYGESPSQTLKRRLQARRFV